MMIVTQSRRFPGIVPVLSLLVVSACIGVLVGNVGIASVALVAPIVVGICVVWPLVGFGLLAVTCAANRLTFSMSGVNVRLDELMGLCLVVAVVLRAAFPVGGTRRQTRLWTSRLTVLAFLGVYLLVNFFSTVSQSSGVSRGISLDILTVDLALLCGAVAIYLPSMAAVTMAARVWVVVAGIEALIGIGAFALFLKNHGVVLGVQLDPVNGAPLVYGTLSEGNIFGSFMAASLVLALALLAGRRNRSAIFSYGLCGLIAVGLLLSATRSAWGAAIVGIVLLPFLSRFGLRRTGVDRRRSRRASVGAGVVVVLIVVGVLIAPASVHTALLARLGSLLDFSSGSGYGRTLLYSEALKEWQSSPLLGTGPGSFAYKLPGDVTTGPAWLPNLFIQILHDSGVIGLAAFLCFLGTFYVALLRALRRAPEGELRAVIVGLIAAVTVLLIAFQLTPGLVLGYPWALIGLGIAAATAAQKATGRATS